MQKSGVGSALTETIIEPSRGWKSPGLIEVWQRRSLLLAFMLRDIKIRYRQTWIGIGWAFVQPALTAACFSLFLGPSLSEGPLPYTLFVFSGFVVWSFFAPALVNSAGSVIASEALIKRIYYPPLLAPLAAVGSCLVDLFVATASVVVIAWLFGFPPQARLLWLPLWITVVALAAAGAGVFLAALSALYRDARHLIPFLVQLALFATPVIFLPTVDLHIELNRGASDAVRSVLTAINPLNALIAFGRALFFNETLPWSSFASATSLCIVVFFLACLFFRRVEDRFADVL